MNLGELLKSSQAHALRHRKVTLRIIGHDDAGVSVKVDDAPACFRFVSDQDRDEAFREADAETKKKYGDGDPPYDRMLNERNYHVLWRALREADKPENKFADSVLQLKRSLVLEEARRVFGKYDEWVREEFPEDVSAEEFDAMIEDAKKNSFSDLLTSYGFAQIQKALPILAETFGK